MGRAVRGLTILALLSACTAEADRNGPSTPDAAPDAALDATIGDPAGPLPEASPEGDPADRSTPPDTPAEATPALPDVEPAGCRTGTPADLAACVDADAYAGHLAFVARERPPGSPGLEAVRAHCEQAFALAGFEVLRHDFGEGENVLGTLRGSGRADEIVVVSAHADHIEGCPGADDNATGTAAVLEAARVLALATWERTLVVACWDAEEEGLLGSTAWAEEAAAQGLALTTVYTLDMLGYVDHAEGSQELPPEIQLLAPVAYQQVKANGSRGDFLVILADPGTLTAANRMATASTDAGTLTYVLKIPEALKLSDEAADLRNSDHASFWQSGYPALAVNDTGPLRNPYTHCAGGLDTVATLDVPFAVGAVRGLVASAAELLGMVTPHPGR